MPFTTPEVGKIYVSQEDPTLSLYVDDVLAVAQDEIGDAGLLVTCCRPEDKDNPAAPCYEFVDGEWECHLFIQAEEAAA